MRIGLLALVCVVVLFSMLHSSQIPEPLRSVDGDWAHVFAYFVLTGFAAVVWDRRGGVLLAAASMLLLSFIVEMMQLAAPGRGFEWKDMGANLAGVCGGALLGWLARALRKTVGGAASSDQTKPPAPGRPVR
jgi:VanZ family protein